MTEPIPPAVLPRLEVEFTVEPFTDGGPGPHVAGAIEAVQRALADVAGATVDIGPFGTSVRARGPAAIAAVGAALEAAFGQGASRVSLQVTASPDHSYPHSA